MIPGHHSARARDLGLSLFLLVLLTLLLISSSSVQAEEEEIEMINRPVNMSGLTGLIFTTAPYTIPTGSVEVSAGIISENSTTPNVIINELPAFSVSAGISSTMELGVKSSYLHKKSDEQSTQRGRGDTELSYKWMFLPQTESSPYPAMALTVTGIAPTGDKELNLGVVAHWGAKLGLSVGREISWRDHVLGAYIDGQIVFHDLSDDRYSDRYGILNIGLLYPISKYRNLQLLVEYNLVSGIDKISDEGGDFTGVTYGLRMVSDRFNLTMGAQFMRKDVSGFDNTSRVIGMTSIKF